MLISESIITNSVQLRRLALVLEVRVHSLEQHIFAPLFLSNLSNLAVELITFTSQLFKPLLLLVQLLLFLLFFFLHFLDLFLSFIPLCRQRLATELRTPLGLAVLTLFFILLRVIAALLLRVIVVFVPVGAILQALEHVTFLLCLLLDGVQLLVQILFLLFLMLIRLCTVDCDDLLINARQAATKAVHEGLSSL